jgi:hypothetical protein
MPPKIAFLSRGKLFVHDGAGEPRPLESRFAESIRTRATQIEDRNAWKTQGRGARFMTGGVLWNQEPQERAVPIWLHSLSRGRAPGELLYALDSGGVSGVLAQPAAADELRLFHSNSLSVHQLCAEPGHPLIACAVRGKAGTSHLALMAHDGSELREVTEGDVLDEAPSWVPRSPTELVYQSAGLGRDPAGHPRGTSPASIHRLELRSGRVEHLLADEAHDYVQPRLDAQGRLYCVRRPRREGSPMAPLRLLLDVALIPVRVLFALFQWVNFFSLRWGGKPLVSNGPLRRQNADPREMFQRGNLFAAQEEAQKGKDAGDDTPALAPPGWHLVRRDPDGALHTLARGVVAFDLASDGTAVYSNGNAVYALSPDGARARLCKGEAIVEVVALA